MKIDPKYTRMDYSVRLLRNLLLYYEDKYGADGLAGLIGDTGMPLEYLNDDNNWVSYDYVCSFFSTLVNRTKDPLAPYNFFVESAKRYGRAGRGNIIKLLTSPATCSDAYRKNININPRFRKSGELILLKLKSGRAVVEYRLRKGLKPDKNDCLSTQGQLASLPVLLDLPPAKVKEIQCSSMGFGSCVYDISWVDYSNRRMLLLSLLGGAAISFLLYLLLNSGILAGSFFSGLVLSAVLLIFYLAGKSADLKETAAGNIALMNQQNDMLVSLLEEIEKIHAKLQTDVEKRTVELQSNIEEMGKKLVELSESEEQLVRSEKMAAVGRLAAGMAHDLNNPIGTIRNLLQDIMEEMPRGDPRHSRLANADRILARGIRVVKDLLSFSRESSSLHLIEVNINGIIEKAVHDAAAQFAGRHIKITVEPGDARTAEVDASQLQQALRNIIHNAGDAISGEGEIKIKTSGDSDNVYVQITDTGEGISGENISKIFDPFFTTRADVPRRGIGLAVSYNIIKRLDGDIEVRSEKGKGTAFTVTIPRIAGVYRE